MFDYSDLKNKIRVELKDKKLIEALKHECASVRLTQRKNRKNFSEYMAVEEAREKLRSIKNYSVSNIDRLVKDATEIFRKNNVTVFVARDEEDVLDYLSKNIEGEIAFKSGTSFLGWGSREINLKKLMDKGIEVIDSDIGDRAIQLLESTRVHGCISSPQLTLEDFAQAYSKTAGRKVNPEVREILNEFREHTLKLMQSKQAKTGITSCNVIAAKDAQIIAMENHGNIRRISNLPQHFVVTPITKLVPTLEDALHVMRCMMFGFGACPYPLSVAYTSFVSSPSRTVDIGWQINYGLLGAKEVHLVLVDNGRTSAINTDLQEALYCLHCGACNNVCESYIQVPRVMNYKYGYFAGIGAVKAYILSKGSTRERLGRSIESGLYLCTDCRACYDICPAKINTPKMINILRRKAVEENLALPPLVKMRDNIIEIGNPTGIE